MRVSFTVDPRALDAFVAGTQHTIAIAAKGAVADAGRIALDLLRADMVGAGLSGKFRAATTLTVFPSGAAIDAAAVIRNKIPWSGIVAEGGTISGAPLLWLPIDANLPSRGDRRWTPQSYAAVGGPLFSIVRPGAAAPLLGIKRDGRTVPVFVGVPQVHVRRHLHVDTDVARAAAQLATLFTKRMKDA